MGTDTRYELAEGTSYSTAVVEAVADENGVDPTDLPALYDAVDPDALDALLASLDADEDADGGRVVFSYGDHTVTVTSGGDVRITPG